jgi:hypothetical protein
MHFFEIISCELFSPGWFQTAIFPTSASWVTRVTDLSHQCPAILRLLWEPQTGFHGSIRYSLSPVPPAVPAYWIFIKYSCIHTAHPRAKREWERESPRLDEDAPLACILMLWQGLLVALASRSQSPGTTWHWWPSSAPTPDLSQSAVQFRAVSTDAFLYTCKIINAFLLLINPMSLCIVPYNVIAAREETGVFCNSACYKYSWLQAGVWSKNMKHRASCWLAIWGNYFPVPTGLP